MLDTVNVLMTGTGAPGAPGIIRCLRKNGEREIRIVGVDMNSKAASRKLVDAFYTVPSAKAPNFIETLLDICKKEEVKVVLPLVTRELGVLAENSFSFLDLGIMVSTPSALSLKIVNNKATLLSKMRELGMETPEFIIAHTVEEIEKSCERLGYPERPLCVKYPEGNGSRGVRIIDAKKSRYDLLFNEKPNSMYCSYQELISTLKERKEIPEMLVMEYLPGEEYGVDALCENGQTLFIAGRYNTKVSSSIPQESILENRAEPLQIAKALIKAMRLDGNINFDFIYNNQGKAMLIEINPRLSATIVAYAPAGINFPYLRIKQLLGENLPKCNLRGVSMQRRYIEVFFDKDGDEIDW